MDAAVGLVVLEAARMASSTSEGREDGAFVDADAGAAEAILADGPRTSEEASSKDCR